MNSRAGQDERRLREDVRTSKGMQGSKAFRSLAATGFGSANPPGKSYDPLDDSYVPEKNFAKSMKRKEQPGGERGHTRSPQRPSYNSQSQRNAGGAAMPRMPSGTPIATTLSP